MTMTEDFRTTLRTAVTGRPDTPLVLIGNFEVEDEWARTERGLPRLTVSGSGRAVANRMDELALLLAAEGDRVVLKDAPDPDHLAQLAGLGLTLPHILVPRAQDPQRTVSADALADNALITTLGTLGDAGFRLAPHGVSAVEEELSARSGLPLATPTAATCKAVNSKIYSRLLATDLALRQPPGRTCVTLDELADALAWAARLIDAGGRVVVKDAFGVSGKGITVVDTGRRLDQVRRMVHSRAARSGRTDVALVVEEWVAKRADLNYHFVVGRDGTVSFDFVKEALTDNGVHQGHRFPARLSATQVGDLAAAAETIGGRLARDGYFGVVGVDAMVDPDDGLYPIVEINARNNMSTYQTVVQQRLVPPGAEVLARHYPLRTPEPLPFAALRRLLDGVLLTPGGRTGLVVTAFATVNAAPPDGRLYALLVADTAARLTALDAEVARRLTTVTEETR
ncbi:ATP-grasp domain-containing protein [Salinispora arenicola]|uniref:ATP-grasp domain-containing protein n=1 Tax=Salinispora arenicola (strain CNS-205) TaxID=391037 RepID=A8M093_SALAI|nr:ATP-grasp domain-containing protein [Salinispora arenicola]MCN0181186.1 ATP-grasp domain-containing protein [Salinispora arenicola]NIL55957.1 ATP-grasp domain-containing protein [Salinispora arenicola]NIL60650.1 ATP-grasp domain-containing protein [Salinispora arenicola]